MGDAIRRLRKERGWTIQVLTDLMEGDASYVNNIELGKRNPSGETLVSFAKAFDMEIDELALEIRRQAEGKALS